MIFHFVCTVLHARKEHLCDCTLSVPSHMQEGSRVIALDLTQHSLIVTDVIMYTLCSSCNLLLLSA